MVRNFPYGSINMKQFPKLWQPLTFTWERQFKTNRRTSFACTRVVSPVDTTFPLTKHRISLEWNLLYAWTTVTMYHCKNINKVINKKLLHTIQIPCRTYRSCKWRKLSTTENTMAGVDPGGGVQSAEMIMCLTTVEKTCFASRGERVPPQNYVVEYAGI